MALPVTIPNTFANATASIPLSQLDTNFNTLANAVNGISDGSETLANASVTVLTAGTVDINGGAIDGTTVGTSNAAAGSFTTLNTSGAVVFNDAGADVDFRVEGDTNANLLFVDASADSVGIGTGSPTFGLGTGLQIAGAGYAALSLKKGSAGVGQVIDLVDDSNVLQFRIGSNFASGGNNLLFAYGTTPTIGMTMDSSGNLLVGTTSGFGSSHVFEATGTTSGDYAGVFKQGAVGANGRIQYWDLTNTDDSAAYFLYATNSSGNCLNIFGNGNITNTNNSYGAISDVKLKKDIVDAGSQWDDLKAIRIRKFSFKNDPDGVLQIGVIAQELEEVSSGLVSEHTDYEMVDVPVLDDEGNPVLDEEGNPTTRQEQQATGETTKSVKYSVLYMKAVKALQEAMERIETLEAKVAALENA